MTEEHTQCVIRMTSTALLVLLVVMTTAATCIAASAGFRRADQLLRNLRQNDEVSCYLAASHCSADDVNSLSPSDPDYTQKLCRIYRSYYDCFKDSTADCITEAIRASLEGFRQSALATCAAEFAGTGP